MKHNLSTRILCTLLTAASFTSCATTDEYADQDTAQRMSRRGAADDAISEARAEGMETQKNITREQTRMKREAAQERARAEDIETAGRMMHRGAADAEPLNDEIDDDYRDAQDRADDIDTAERMMGRGAAN